jgi:UDP-N-acetylmuramate--alanine ligase
MTDELHFIGIGGIGMSALARIALARGLSVSGSNDKESDTTRRLRQEGARVEIGHAAGNIVGRPRIIVTSAVAAENAELQAAQAAGLAIMKRGELLAELFNATRGIAVAGTHGKTTVTGMIATVFEEAGLDPTVAVGGLRRESGTNFRCGAGPWFVTESDESDGSFVHLRPEIGVVLNIENDHITSDDGMVTLREQFRTFVGNIGPGGVAIIGIDDVEAEKLSREPFAGRLVTFGFSAYATIRATKPVADGLGTISRIFEDGLELGELVLQVPGAINVANALAAISVARLLDIPFAVIARALARFGGVRRRFDILHRSSRMIVVDDYAHHPTAVKATITAARAAHKGPIVVAFQAHRYTRTAYLAADFAVALRDADQTILPEIYAASEEPQAGIDEHLIGAPLERAGRKVAYVPRAELVEYLLANTPHKALVLLLGAGDITSAAHELAYRLSHAGGSGAGEREAGERAAAPTA